MDRHYFVYTLGDNALLLYFLCFFRNDLRTSRKYRSDKKYKNITSKRWRLFWKFWRITIPAEALAENRLSERLITVTRRKLQSFHLSNSIFCSKMHIKFCLAKNYYWGGIFVWRNFKLREMLLCYVLNCFIL